MITSVHNPRVKALLRLRKHRERDETGTFLIEGYRELRRAVGVVPIRTLYYCPALWADRNEPGLLAAAVARGATPIELAEEPFRRVSGRDRPDGVLGVGVQTPTDLDRLTLPPESLVLVVEAVEKPGNLGTMFRTADAAGVAAMICCDPVTDPFNPSTVRASAGSLFSVPLAVADLVSTLAWLAAHGIQPVAATPAANRRHWDVDLTGPTAVVVGSERSGLSEAWLSTAERARVPMAGHGDSLNVAMAAGTILFEAVRQRAQA